MAIVIITLTDISNVGKGQVIDTSKIYTGLENQLTRLQPVGFDPGFNLRLAAMRNPDDSTISNYIAPAVGREDYYYSEFCSDEPTEGKCHNKDIFGIGYFNIPVGGGYYSLSGDNGGIFAGCPVSSGLPYFNVNTGAIEPCPYYFNWKTDADGKNVANIKTDNLNFSDPTSKNLYWGIDEDVTISNSTTYSRTCSNPPCSAGGISTTNQIHSPLLSDIDIIKLKYRARVCQKLGDSLGGRTTRVTYYFTWVTSTPKSIWEVGKARTQGINHLGSGQIRDL